jgi:hypothetical protein
VQIFVNAFAWIDRVVTEATSARKLIGHLVQSFLARAFRGELVPQDAGRRAGRRPPGPHPRRPQHRPSRVAVALAPMQGSAHAH